MASATDTTPKTADRLSADELRKIDAYWRVQPAVGMIISAPIRCSASR
jgi:hypothetical protein